jgi:murein DD-endopeptidase MepM/ murein hydrolase activator NlpD
MSLTAILQQHRAGYHPVVPFDAAKDKLYAFDFTGNNSTLSPEVIADTDRFAAYISRHLRENEARYGIGGYGEDRTLYARSKHFDTAPGASPASAASAEPRRLHLGVDIWGPAGTKIMAPLNGFVHSFAFNNNDSDYGATLILTHNLDGKAFHTLYGHLSLNSIKGRTEGEKIEKGEVIAEFGMRFENGNWPPHLHFQLIEDMQGRKGDYPGVCRFSERREWLENCPDPNIILRMQA